jgi:hypothetical protein
MIGRGLFDPLSPGRGSDFVCDASSLLERVSPQPQCVDVRSSSVLATRC